MNTETIILKSLITNEEYTRKVLPFIKEEYFQSEEDKTLFSHIRAFILQYNKSPTVDSLLVEIDAAKGLREETVRAIKKTLSEIGENKEKDNLDWLTKKTEDFCRDRAIYNAIMLSIGIIQDDKSTLTKGAIPQLLTDALSVSFDAHVGHDFLEQADERFEYYHRKEERIPFDLDFFNKITRNGLPKKTLTIAMAGPNVGKSLFMCHTAASFLNLGKKVLYVTLEMREEEIAKRIDTNMMNITFTDLEALSKDMYQKRINSLKAKTNGTLIIKEYPTGGASTIHFKALMNELAIKKQFVPDAIFIDYMNICASSRMKLHNTPKHYYVQSISEELRAMASEYNLPVVTGTQVNRGGFASSEVGMENISESFGVNATADLLFYMMTNEVLEQLGQLEVTQLKNRLNSKAKNRKFVIGVDYDKMKLYDVEAAAQNISNSGQEDPPVFDKTDMSGTLSIPSKGKFKLLKVI
jgi:replicative DNA helicase